jgi:hypothetical protein
MSSSRSAAPEAGQEFANWRPAGPADNPAALRGAAQIFLRCIRNAVKSTVSDLDADSRIQLLTALVDACVREDLSVKSYLLSTEDLPRSPKRTDDWRSVTSLYRRIDVAAAHVAMCRSERSPRVVFRRIDGASGIGAFFQLWVCNASVDVEAPSLRMPRTRLLAVTGQLELIPQDASAEVFRPIPSDAAQDHPGTRAPATAVHHPADLAGVDHTLTHVAPTGPSAQASSPPEPVAAVKQTDLPPAATSADPGRKAEVQAPASEQLPTSSGPEHLHVHITPIRNSGISTALLLVMVPLAAWMIVSVFTGNVERVVAFFEFFFGPKV